LKREATLSAAVQRGPPIHLHVPKGERL
jgi:hypothetical protein